MSIIGESQTGTIINGTNTNWIFQIASDVNVTIQNLTLTNGKATVGGAIYNYGTCTLNNCNFTDNAATVGGAIYNAGTCTMSNCNFTGNAATVGGAIFNYGTCTLNNCNFTGNTATYNGAIYNYGTCTMSNCNFTDNTAIVGGAIFNYGTCTVSNCNFTRNTAIVGGAIYNAGTCTVHFSRFFNNTASSASAICSIGGPANVENNWWSSNNPNWNNLISGFTHPVNWIILTVNATPNSINNTQTSTITADLNHINGGGDLIGGHIPAGTPVTFSLTNGPLGTLTAPLTVNTIDGIASIIFTASQVGVQDVNGTLDDQNIATSITINPAAYVDITKEFRDLPWGNIITTAHYNDKIYAIVMVQNQGPDPTSLSVLDSFTGINWTGNYYVLSGSINPTDPNNWVLNDPVNTFNGTHWNIPYFSSFIGGNVKWLAIEGIINQTGTVSNHAETVDQSSYPYDGFDSYTAYLTSNHLPTSLTVDNAHGNKDETVTLKAALKDHQGNPLIGKKVEFWVDAVKVGENTTDINGTATFDYKITPTSGNHTLEAVFNGDTEYLASSVTGQLYVPKSDLYIKITSNNNNPKLGQTFTITYKLGNNGPDESKNVTITIPLPEGFKYTDISGDGNWTYNASTNTITWTLTNVPVGDPYLYISGYVNKPGTYIFSSSISSETYNINTEGVTPITINTVTEVKAASKTIGMQNTGLPISGLIFAILVVFSGLATSKRK